MTLGERIRAIRMERGETQEDFARATDKAGSDISQFENNKSKPTIPFLWKLGSMGYSMDWILLEEGEMKRSSVIGGTDSDRITEERLTELEATSVRALQIARDLRRDVQNKG